MYVYSDNTELASVNVLVGKCKYYNISCVSILVCEYNAWLDA